MLTQQKSMRLTNRGGKPPDLSPRSVDSDDVNPIARERLVKVEAKLSQAEINLERIRGERDDAFKYLKLLGNRQLLELSFVILSH